MSGIDGLKEIKRLYPEILVIWKVSASHWKKRQQTFYWTREISEISMEK